MAAKKTAQKATPRPKLIVAAPAAPTTDASLLALSASYAAAPDIPVAVAVAEIASLARLAKSQQASFTAIGLGPDSLDNLAGLGRRLVALEKAWAAARDGVKLTPAQKKLRDEAEILDNRLVAGGRWACRKDEKALADLTVIADGSGLLDTIQDLRELVVFWAAHPDELAKTDITAKDLARATFLADSLDVAAASEESNVDAARALDLRNRAFWASDEAAKEVREGGRYAFRGEPKVAAKFISRYRATAAKRSRRKSKADKPAAAPVG
jgi:hypothetical protein